MKPPTRTRCGNCNAKIRLRRDDWHEFTDDAGELIGLMQTRRCKCGCEVVGVLSNWMNWRSDPLAPMH